MNARASHPSGTVPILLLAAAMAVPRPALAQEEWPPRLRIGDSFSIRPQGLLHLDLGTTFDQNRPGGPGGGVNARRARIGVEGGFLDDFEFKLVWDFGGAPGSRNRLYQASVAYTGLGSAAVIAGVFEPTFLLQQSSATQNLLFLERATVVRVAWWPVRRIAVYGQYQHVDITGLESGRRSFQTLALRAMVNF